MKAQLNYRTILFRELQDRTNRKKCYSLRTFAEDLEISHTTLSQVLNYKCGLSLQKAQSISRKLQLKKWETEVFTVSVQAEHARQKDVRDAANSRLTELLKTAKTKELEQDEFTAVANWQNFAVLEFLKIKSRFSDLESIAKRLRLSTTELQMTLARLEKLALIEKQESGYLVLNENVVGEKFRTPEIIQKYHHQVLGKIAEAIPVQPKEERYSDSRFFTIRKKDIPAATQKLRQFYDQFINEYSEPSELPADEVYCLSSHFFRITEVESK